MLRRRAAPRRPGRCESAKINPLDASADTDFLPGPALADGEVVEGDGWALRAMLTPGHAANHAAFALEGPGILFSGRSRHGLVNLDRRAAGRRDVRLYGLARPAARRATTASICPAMAARSNKPRAFMRGLKGTPQDARARNSGARRARRQDDPGNGQARSIATPIRGCMARRRCQCWRISRISWRAAAVGPTARRRSTEFRPA